MSNDTYRSFRVIATLEQGIVLDSRFGVGLDALLASTIRSREKARQGVSGVEYDGGINYLVQNQVQIVELPLSRCTAGPDWHWNATCALPVDFNNQPLRNPERDVRTWIQKDDHVEIEKQATALPKNMPPSFGRWRKRRVAVPVTLAPKVLWQGHGDINLVRDLLNDISSIGGKRNAGEGAVQYWEVEPLDINAMRAGHLLHRENTLLRPSFPACLEHLPPIETTRLRTIKAGLRPPYWHLGHQHDLLIQST